MPKAYRGGKGRAEPPLTEKQREFDEIDRIDGYGAVIMAKPTTFHFQLPLFSNSSDTVYFSIHSEAKQQYAIGIYRDYQLVESIDYDKWQNKDNNHYHIWEVNTVRNKKTISRADTKERQIISAYHKDLIRKFDEGWGLHRWQFQKDGLTG